MVDRDESKVRTFTGNEAKQKVWDVQRTVHASSAALNTTQPDTRTIFFLLFVAHYNTYQTIMV